MDNGINEGKLPKPALNSPRHSPNHGARTRGKPDAIRDGVAVPGWMKGPLPDGASGGEERFRFTSRDGDALEKRSGPGAGACYAGASRGGSPIEALGKSEAAKAAEDGAGPTSGPGEAGEAVPLQDAEADPKEKRLAELRTWAEGVEKELRLQQQRLLERLLKEPGRHVQSGDGKFLIIIAGPDAAGAADAESAESCGEAQVPEYWNAENTSDRIVHFATQMAEICGLDPAEFAEKITQAVSNGFDQANAETGPLPGAAGKLNRDTRDLVFSKLSKWLEDRKSGEYNVGAPPSPASTSDVTHGTENNE